MKIAILTHRLGHNYGGILQAYALQLVVSSMVANSDVVVYHAHPLKRSRLARIRSTIWRSLRYRRLYINSRKIETYLMSPMMAFVNRYIGNIGDNFDANSADFLIVGSDQVWRAAYVDPVSYMFGDIRDDTIKRISYAASFGVGDLSEYTQAQIEMTSQLAKKFSALSVREASGVNIIKKYWGIEAFHHVDPTLLVDANEYIKLIDDGQTKASSGSLFVYVLDHNEKNLQIINKVEELTATKSFDLSPKIYMSLFAFLKDKHAYTMPKIQQWLRSFQDAKFVVTDSFHGTVFSIIFNKPFISIGNKGRGLARFSSLLKIFGLEDRLVSNVSDITKELLDKKIDWAAVNAIKKKEQKRSIEYLKKYLGAIDE